MLPDGEMVVRGRETRVQTTTRPDHILPSIGRPCLEDNKRRRLSAQKTSDKLARLVNELHFECGPDTTNKPNISALLR
eukprot:9281342-Pyramimonas_sp.AAC.1